MIITKQVNLERSLLRYLKPGMHNAENLIREHIREMISIPGPPRSKPGDPPHVDEGVLHSTFTSTSYAGGGTISFAVGSPCDHGLIMEIGGMNDEGIYVAARPYLVPGLDQTKDDMADLILEETPF